MRLHLVGRSGLHSIIGNSSWLLGDRLFRMALALTVGAWVARYLGPARYGELAYLLALLALTQVACSLGMESIAVRNIAHRPFDSHRILGTALALRLAAAAAGWLTMILLALVMRPGNGAALVMAAFLGASLVLQASDVVDLWFQSQTRSRHTVRAKLLAYSAASFVKVALILQQAPLWTFAAAFLVDVAMAAAALTWTYRRYRMPERWTWDRGVALALLRESWPLMVAGLSVVIYMRIDQLILGAMTDQRQLGLYSAILPFSQAWHIVPMTVCASVLPRFSALVHTDPVLYRKRLQQLFVFMAWSGTVVAALTALAAGWLVALLLGPDFSDAAKVLRWHALSNVFVFLGVAQSVAIVSEGTPKLSLVKTLCGAGASVTLNFLLVPQWGAVGAAWAAIGAYFCAAVLSNVVLAPASFSMQVKAFWPFHAQRT